MSGQYYGLSGVVGRLLYVIFVKRKMRKLQTILFMRILMFTNVESLYNYHTMAS